MRLIVCTLLSAALSLIPRAGQAQVGPAQDECNVIESSPTAITHIIGRGEVVYISGGARFTCRDGRTIRSDSVARYRASGITEFHRNVRYTDEDNILTAGYVRYMEEQRQAIAQTNVRLTDKATGSVITGPYMNYYEATDERPESRVEIPSGRPHAVLVSVSKADSTRRDTTEVDADAMDILGRGSFTGRGNVVLIRADLTGTGGFSMYSRDDGDLRLWQNARLETPDYTLSSDTIHGLTDEADELDQVTAIGTAVLDASDVDVNAPRIIVFLEAGEVARLVAVGEPAAPDEPLDVTRQAVVVSEDFRMTADSIDALAPGQALEKVYAIGRSWAERLDVDIADANVPAIASRDWMKGDTIIATFVEVPDTAVVQTRAAADSSAPADTARTRREVETVLALGGSGGERAASLNRVRDEEDPQAPVAINYLLARRILVHLKDGQVDTVEPSGEVQGVYLDPIRRPAQPTGGVTQRPQERETTTTRRAPRPDRERSR